MTGSSSRYGLSSLTVAQRKAFDVLVDAYYGYIAVEIKSKTRVAMAEGIAQVSRTVARNLVAHGMADYSPAGTYLLLSEQGKREARIGR